MWAVWQTFWMATEIWYILENDDYSYLVLATKLSHKWWRKRSKIYILLRTRKNWIQQAEVIFSMTCPKVFYTKMYFNYTKYPFIPAVFQLQNSNYFCRGNQCSFAKNISVGTIIELSLMWGMGIRHFCNLVSDMVRFYAYFKWF